MRSIACITTTLALLSLTSAKAQFFDDFSGGHLYSWSGDTADFIVNTDGQLQLNAAGAGASTITSTLAFPDSISWTIDLRTDFSPSTSNRVGIILLADSPDLANGYAIEIGDTGSPDPVCFYSIDNGLKNMLACTPGLFGDEIDTRITVTYQLNGDWHISAGSPGQTPVQVLSFNELMHPQAYRIFAISCYYTSSRTDQFYFDNISIDRIYPDTTPPRVHSLVVQDSRSIDLIFNETLSRDDGSLEITPFPGPLQITKYSSSIHIGFQDSLSHGATYMLTASGISDTKGNVASDTIIEFTYWRITKPQPGDILITEILPDPTPSRGLPEVEFIEIHNNSANACNTGDLILFIDERSTTLPDHILAPGTWMVLQSHQTQNISSDQQLLIAELPPLRNSYGNIALQDSSGHVIHQMQYHEELYDALQMPPGGLSLELSDPETPCFALKGWRPSTHLTGGTPGEKNSFVATPVETELEYQYYYFDPIANEVTFSFDQYLATPQQPGVHLSPPEDVIAIKTNKNQLIISFANTLIPDADYAIVIDSLLNCTLSPTDRITVTFRIPQGSSEGMVVNEVLFDPAISCPQFIELLNASPYAINSNELAMTYGTSNNQFDIQRTIPPGGIICFTPKPLVLHNCYPQSTVGKVAYLDISALDRQGEIIILHTREGIILDSARYATEMHHPAIDDTRGVSLERVNPTFSGMSVSSWLSASGTSGWATPGRLNSQYFDATAPVSPYTLAHNVFSPDGDGYEDVLVLQCGETLAGSIITATVFDLTGRMVRLIADHILAGTDTVITWDGAGSDGNLASPGAFLILVEANYSPNRTEYYKETVVLARRF